MHSKIPNIHMHHSNQAITINHHNLCLVILVVLLVISTTCQPTSSVPVSTATPWSVAKLGLSRNQQKWHDAGISHYHFRLFHVCICEDNEDVLIEVKDGQILSLEYQSGKTMNPNDRTDFEGWGTMERLFLTVENELNSDSLKVNVTYDLTYGFPAEISSERSAGSDDELHLIVSDFEVLP